MIAHEIKNRGIIGFAEFMKLALYCPVYGFYEKEKDTIGRRGDFFTSVSVGELFGQLLAYQFAEWLTDPTVVAAIPNGFQIVETGAHQGQLAKDILTWLRFHRPSLYDGLRYCIIEPSARRRDWQGTTLAEFVEKVHWIGRVEEIGQISGVIFSNEFLDSLPVSRISWNAARRTWLEWGVVLVDGNFQWHPMPSGKELPSCNWLARLPDALLDVMPDGFTTEICPEAERWWGSAALALQSGRLMTIDYGGSVQGLIAPQRKDGTLRAYKQHHLNPDLLACPGEQDLTAHVNFTAIEEAGFAAGLLTEQFISQARFLTDVFQAFTNRDALSSRWKSNWTRQFQTLTNPDHLGHSFEVLVQRPKTHLRPTN